MPVHPPWLRFQAYAVGLPKTGSTSLATLFGNYRTAHEWQMRALLGPALARLRGELDDEAFLSATGRRFVPAALEMDSASCHHLYAEVLRDRFPAALFIHTMRDVRSWIASLLDMALRKRLAQRLIGLPDPAWSREYVAMLTGGAYDQDPDAPLEDRACLVPLLRYWAAQVRGMLDQLPGARSLHICTGDIGKRLPEIAGLIGVPVATLRADLSHANRAPIRFDRFAAFDSEELRAAYAADCADLMAEFFPAEHAAWQNRRPAGGSALVGASDWDSYLAALQVWVAEAVRRHGASVAY
jgi:hypothetical protein